MAKLFVTNCTKKIKEFHFWVPEVGRPIHQKVAPGQQVQLYKDAPLDDLKKIVEQHIKYGWVEASQAHKAKGFVGVCYSYNEPTNLDELGGVLEKNDEALDQLSQDTRKESLAALNDSIERSLEEAGIPQELNRLETSIQEESKPGESGEKMKENMKINKNAKAD